MSSFFAAVPPLGGGNMSCQHLSVPSVRLILFSIMGSSLKQSLLFVVPRLHLSLMPELSL